MCERHRETTGESEENGNNILSGYAIVLRAIACGSQYKLLYR